MGDFSDVKSYAHFDNFSVAGANDNYRLNVSGYTGVAGDSFTYHSGAQFSTRDQDNDINGGNCATQYSGAWWYRDCYTSNLNGLYYGISSFNTKGINWWSWRTDPLKFTEMKSRRN